VGWGRTRVRAYRILAGCANLPAHGSGCLPRVSRAAVLASKAKPIDPGHCVSHAHLGRLWQVFSDAAIAAGLVRRADPTRPSLGGAARSVRSHPETI
jgi:hypothetical protein